ncbi:hypothetical protein RclHR1_14290007 [Rhizophagus clarus]|nr:hypothetical protein RclHR1_14290007 [Rhizophagus clarus]
MPHNSFQDILFDNEENGEFEESISLQVTSHKQKHKKYLPEEENEPSNTGDTAPLLSNSSRESIAPDLNSVIVLENGDTLKKPKDGGSFFESFLNMANSIIGAGIIG